MDYRPNKCQLSLTWDIPICIRPKTPASTKDGDAYVSDLDATLTVNYWDAGDDEYEWQVVSAAIDSFEVTRLSDPLMWGVFERGINRERESLHEKVVERIREMEGR